MKVFDLKTLVRKNIWQMQSYSSARDEYEVQNANWVYLDANENPYPSKVNRYPDPLQRSLKSELAQLRQVSPEQILIGNGSDEILDLIFRAFAEPKVDQLLTFPPTYGMYQVLAHLNEISILEAPLAPDTFDLDFETIERELQKEPKLICLPNPNNPSGNGWPIEVIERLVKISSGIVVIDEAYIDFAPFESAISLLNRYPHLIVSQTFSKAFGMAGARLGIAYASAEIIALLNRIKPPYNINSYSQQEALTRLREESIIKKEIKTILQEKESIMLKLSNINFVDQIFRSDANFILIRVDDAQKRYRQFLEAGVVVRNRSTQLHCENTLRVSIGTPQENLKFLEVCSNLDV